MSQLKHMKEFPFAIFCLFTMILKKGLSSFTPCLIHQIFGLRAFAFWPFKYSIFSIFHTSTFLIFDLFNFRPFSGCHSQRRDREGQGRSKAGQTSRRRNFSRRIHRRFCLQRWTSNSFLRIFVKFKFPFCILRLKHV